MLRSAGLVMQANAMTLNSRPEPANIIGSDTTFSTLPATAADSGPRPMKVNISTLIVRPIICGATRRWIQLMIDTWLMPPSAPVIASSVAPPSV